ncbi:unnamed protein product [Cuscuta campestris]|uniref:CRM domain-containing protein n=1 Tax=Cuscuta campestris TaxID=132261 RepID=A0A484KB34_9ASTE|nr:unnamed protein product [Cuscuta campestris]
MLSSFVAIFSRHRHLHLPPSSSARHFLSAASLPNSSPTSSKLRSMYSFTPPPSLKPRINPNPPDPKPPKPRYRPPSSLDRGGQPAAVSDLPFDFRFSYSESSPTVRPIGLREPKYSPFGPGRLDRVWTGVCAPVVDPRRGSQEDERKLREKRREMWAKIQGVPLTDAERNALVERCQRHKTKRQINLGRDGLTHNMLIVIHDHWKHTEVVRIKCMGVPTVNMKNLCSHLEEKTFGKVIHIHGGFLVLYRGRNYDRKKIPEIPLMLWKPHEPVYPRLIKTTIEGLSIEETKEMRKRGLAVPVLTKLAKNGYYASLVPMVRDAFLTDELVRIDCGGLPKSDYRKIGCKLKDLVPCILVTFAKEQIVVWRGKDYKPPNNGDDFLLPDREPFDNNDDDEAGPPPKEDECLMRFYDGVLNVIGNNASSPRRPHHCSNSITRPTARA